MKFSAGAEREIPPMCRNTFAKQIFHSEAISLVRRTNFIKKATDKSVAFLVEEGGFEPPKRDATDLQSAPFGHSGTPPYLNVCASTPESHAVLARLVLYCTSGKMSI